MRAAVSAAALVALVAVVGTLAYVSARDDHDPPATTTTTTSPLTPEAAVAAVADALATGLAAPLTPDEARCVADGMVDALGPAGLGALAVTGDGADLRQADRDALVRMVVGCLPEDKAAALLSSGSTTTIAAQLPDEGAGG
jgi:hypothetical protein